MAARGQRRRSGELFNRDRTSVLEDEESSRDEWWGQEQKLRMYFVPLTGALEHGSDGNFYIIFSTTKNKLHLRVFKGE